MAIVTKGSGGSIKFSGTGGGISITSSGGGGGGGGGGFDPSSLGNLSSWFKADALGLSNGATVTSWTDSAGGNTLNGYGGTPTYNASDAQFGNMPSVSFNGSSFLYKSSPSGLPSGATAYSMYVVAYADNTNSDSTFTILGWGQAATMAQASVSSLQPAWGGPAYFINYNTGDYAVKKNDAHGPPAVVISVSLSAGAHPSTTELYVNDQVGTVQPGYAGYGYTLSINPVMLVIGSAVGDLGIRNFCGKFAEGLIYSEQHDNTKRLQVTQYLANKYGISI
jgi:hypothetical protein